MQPSGIGDPNTKLGALVHAWSILAGETCPGKTKLCTRLCYAKHGNFLWDTVTNAHSSNADFADTEDFAEWMIHELKRKFVRVLRVHVAGDFFNEKYINDWIQIVRECPETKFYAYTRSWRVEALFPRLIALANEPNIQLWWSIDRESGPAPLVPGVRMAYLAINDTDAMTVPNDVDLLFRNRAKTPMISSNGVMVCPVENKDPAHIGKHTCSSCGVCFSDRIKPKWQKELLDGSS